MGYLLGLIALMPAAMVVFDIVVGTLMLLVQLLMDPLVLPVKPLVLPLVLLVQSVMETLMGDLIIVIIHGAVVVTVMPALMLSIHAIMGGLMFLIQAVVSIVVLLVQAVMDVVVTLVQVLVVLVVAVTLIVRIGRSAADREKHCACAQKGNPSEGTDFHTLSFEVHGVGR